MLTSIKRKILSIICVFLATASLVCGLVLKYSNNSQEDNTDTSVQGGPLGPEIFEVDNPSGYLEDNYLISSP